MSNCPLRVVYDTQEFHRSVTCLNIPRGRLFASALSRLADFELQHGHHNRAEYLAALAEEARSQ